MFPTDCGNNCDFLVTYNATNSSEVEFELSGKGDWVAVGFSDDQIMVIIWIILPVATVVYQKKMASIAKERMISNLEAPLPYFTAGKLR